MSCHFRWTLRTLSRIAIVCLLLSMLLTSPVDARRPRRRRSNKKTQANVIPETDFASLMKDGDGGSDAVAPEGTQPSEDPPAEASGEPSETASETTGEADPADHSDSILPNPSDDNESTANEESSQDVVQEFDQNSGESSEVLLNPEEHGELSEHTEVPPSDTDAADAVNEEAVLSDLDASTQIDESVLTSVVDQQASAVADEEVFPSESDVHQHVQASANEGHEDTLQDPNDEAAVPHQQESAPDQPPDGIDAQEESVQDNVFVPESSSNGAPEKTNQPSEDVASQNADVHADASQQQAALGETAQVDVPGEVNLEDVVIQTDGAVANEEFPMPDNEVRPGDDFSSESQPVPEEFPVNNGEAQDGTVDLNIDVNGGSMEITIDSDANVPQENAESGQPSYTELNQDTTQRSQSDSHAAHEELSDDQNSNEQQRDEHSVGDAPVQPYQGYESVGESNSQSAYVDDQQQLPQDNPYDGSSNAADYNTYVSQGDTGYESGQHGSGTDQNQYGSDQYASSADYQQSADQYNQYANGYPQDSQYEHGAGSEPNAEYESGHSAPQYGVGDSSDYNAPQYGVGSDSYSNDQHAEHATQDYQSEYGAGSEYNAAGHGFEYSAPQYGAGSEYSDNDNYQHQDEYASNLEVKDVSESLPGSMVNHQPADSVFAGDFKVRVDTEQQWWHPVATVAALWTTIIANSALFHTDRLYLSTKRRASAHSQLRTCLTGTSAIVWMSLWTASIYFCAVGGYYLFLMLSVSNFVASLIRLILCCRPRPASAKKLQ